MRWYQEQELADISGVRDLTEYSSKSTAVKVRIGSKRTKAGMVGIGQNSKRWEWGMVKMSRDKWCVNQKRFVEPVGNGFSNWQDIIAACIIGTFLKLKFDGQYRK